MLSYPPSNFQTEHFTFYQTSDNLLFEQKHSHKKRKDSLEARAVLLIFSPELEIFGATVQSIHQNSEKLRLLQGTA